MSALQPVKSKLTKLYINGVPIYINKDATVAQQNKLSSFKLTRPVNKTVTMLPMYKEDLIFSTENLNDDILKGKFKELKLVNRLHKPSNTSQTLAKYVTCDNQIVQNTSDQISNLIGAKNYDTLFVALCSVINQDLKIRAMLAMLTPQKKSCDAACQTDFSCEVSNESGVSSKKYLKETHTQTDEISPPSCFGKLKRIKRRASPFVVKDNKKEENNQKIINSDDILGISKGNKIPDKPEFILPDIKIDIDEDSNCSHKSHISLSNLSVCSEVLNQMTQLINCTDHKVNEINTEIELSPNNKEFKSADEKFSENFNPTQIITRDGTVITVPMKPEDQFHLATPDILKNITTAERKKLIWHQFQIDYELCLETDEDGNLPLHLAVLNNDVELIKRQGLVLKRKGKTVDIMAENGLRALELSIKHNSSVECTENLLELGANPLLPHKQQKTPLHMAAERDTKHLAAILKVISQRARQIIEECEEFQFLHWMCKSDNELAQYLHIHASLLYDSDGYTPLMLASKLGKHENVKLLAETCPETIDTTMTNTGNTAIYIAVTEACTNTIENGKLSTGFEKTIEVLIDSGANIEIPNNSGTKVKDVLLEFNIHSLSMLIANKLSSKVCENLFDNCDTIKSFMITKDRDNQLKVLETTTKKDKTVQRVTIEKLPKTTATKVAMKQNEPLKPETSKGQVLVHKKKCIIMPNLKKIIDKPANIRIVLQPKANGSNNTFEIKVKKPVITKVTPLLDKIDTNNALQNTKRKSCTTEVSEIDKKKAKLKHD